MPRYWQKILDRGRDMNNPGIRSEKQDKLFQINNLLLKSGIFFL